MKPVFAKTFLTLGLLVKACAIVVCLIVAWPMLNGPSPVAAQEQTQGEKAPQADKEQNKDQEQKKDLGDAAEKARKGVAPSVEEAPEDPLDSPDIDPRIMTLLDSKRQELVIEEERIKRERQDLDLLRKEIDLRIAELKKVQNALEELVAAEQKQRRKRIQQLVKVLSNMRPPAAAKVIEKLDDQMAVEIFKLMQSRQAGKVMANIKPTQAARISELLTKQKKSRKAAQLAEQAAKRATQPNKKP